MKHLPLELARAQEKIEGVARKLGLTFFQTVFEVVDYDQMNALAAYGGFPTRYPHYRFGMEYQRMSKNGPLLLNSHLRAVFNVNTQTGIVPGQHGSHGDLDRLASRDGYSAPFIRMGREDKNSQKYGDHEKNG